MRENARKVRQKAPLGALLREGQALAELGDLTRAEQYLARAHAEGRDRESLVALLSVCIRASRLRSAVTYAEPYLLDHPRELPLLQLIAALLLGLGEAARAGLLLERALQIEPESPEAHYLLARVQLTQATQLRDDPPAWRVRSRLARIHLARYVALAPHGPHAEEARSVLAARGARGRP